MARKEGARWKTSASLRAFSLECGLGFRPRLGQFLLGLKLRGDVLDRSHEAAGLAVGVAHEGDVDLRPDGRAIGAQVALEKTATAEKSLAHFPDDREIVPKSSGWVM